MNFQVWAVEQEKTSEWPPPGTQAAKLYLVEESQREGESRVELKVHMETEEIV